MSVSITSTPAKTPVPPIVFKEYDETARKRLIMSVEGLHGCGKTNFSLTAPGPVAVHNFDDGLEGVVEKFIDKKKIYPFHYRIPQSIALPGTPAGNSLSDSAKKIWEEFVLNFRASLPDMGTVVVDTGSESWELARLARLGKLTQVLPHQYTAVNAEFRELLRLGYRYGCNVILLHKLKKEYLNDKPTGNYEKSGFGDVDFIVQTTLRAYKDPKGEGLDRFRMKVSKCRPNPLLEETEFVGEQINFPFIASAITGTESEEWK